MNMPVALTIPHAEVLLFTTFTLTVIHLVYHQEFA